MGGISRLIIMNLILLFCIVLFTSQDCIKAAGLPGKQCEHIQEAGQELAENINRFDKLLQDVVMRCYEEAQLIIESSLRFLKNHMGGMRLSKTAGTAPIESTSKMAAIGKSMGIALRLTFSQGHTKFFELVKKAGDMVVEDSIVTGALIQYNQNTKRSVPHITLGTLNNIDDKISTLRQDMNTSLISVEKNLHNVAKLLFTMLTDSLKDLVTDQNFKIHLDNIRGSMSSYLISAVHSVIDSHHERFFILVKHSAQLIEMIDSIVAPMKNDPKKLSEALSPAKELIDEAISDLKKSIGLNEMNRQLKMKLTWIQKIYGDLKTSLQG